MQCLYVDDILRQTHGRIHFVCSSYIYIVEYMVYCIYYLQPFKALEVLSVPALVRARCEIR